MKTKIYAAYAVLYVVWGSTYLAMKMAVATLPPFTTAAMRFASAGLLLLLIGRVLESRGMDFWESGMDLKHGDDIYDSFRSYQNKLLREYSSMADEFHFHVVDARRSVDHIQEELRKQVGAFLEPAEKPLT